jgi:carnitine O-acetyltransferase
MVPPHTTKTGPLCMNQYKGIFGVTRIPDMPKDRLEMSFPPKGTHIIVMVRDQMFKVEVLGKGGKRVKIEDIQR